MKNIIDICKQLQYKRLHSRLVVVLKQLAQQFIILPDFLKPDPFMWKGAGWGMAILSMILILIGAIFMIRPLGLIIPGGFVLYFIIISAAGAVVVHLILQLIGYIPLLYRLILFASAILLLQYWSGFAVTLLVMAGSCILVGSVLGGIIGVLWKRNWRMMLKGKKILNLVMGLTGLSGLVFWLHMDLL